MKTSNPTCFLKGHNSVYMKREEKHNAGSREQIKIWYQGQSTKGYQRVSIQTLSNPSIERGAPSPTALEHKIAALNQPKVHLVIEDPGTCSFHCSHICGRQHKYVSVSSNIN